MASFLGDHEANFARHQEFWAAFARPFDASSDEEGEDDQDDAWERGGNEEEKLMLLLSLTDDCSPAGDQQRQWAADHGVEWVPLPSDPPSPADMKQTRSLLEDCEGWDRLVDSLLTIPWRNTTPKPKEMKTTQALPTTQTTRTETSHPSTPSHEGEVEEQGLFLPLMPECKNSLLFCYMII